MCTLRLDNGGRAIVDAFLGQAWSEEPRHQRRIDILAEYERTGEAPAVPGA